MSIPDENAIETRGGAEPSTLAGRINEEHRAFIGSLQKTAEHGIRCGELLTEAKGQCGHGEWLPWLEANFEGSARTAQGYMRLYANREQLQANTQSVAHLGIAGALKELAEPEATGLAELPPEEASILDRARRDFGGHLSVPYLTRPKPNGEPLEPERRRGFVAEVAWAAMVAQGRRYAEVKALTETFSPIALVDALMETHDKSPSLKPERAAVRNLLTELEDHAERLRWWVEKVERLDTIVRACDWPPGRGMPWQAFDDEKKHLPLSELYEDQRYRSSLDLLELSEDALRAMNDEPPPLPSPRARIREFCGGVV